MSSPIPQVSLGGSASHIKIGQVGFGLMGMTWCDPSNTTPDEVAFETMKASVDSGSNFWNTGAFYGPQSDPLANLKLIKRFFDANPSYKEKVVLSVKGGMDLENYAKVGALAPSAKIEVLEKDLNIIRQTLGTESGGKEIDLYEMARVDRTIPIEEAMFNLLSLSSQTYKDPKTGEEKKGKGLFHHISLSEVGAQTIRKAAKVAPIAFVEIEYSPLERSAEELGVVKACEELGIVIAAYSPLGKGMFSGTLKSRSEIPQGDLRLRWDRFSEENFEKNLSLPQALEQVCSKLASDQTVTPSQLTLAWLIQRSEKRIIVPIPGTSKPDRVRENASSANVTLKESEIQEIDRILQNHKVHGDRYNQVIRQHGLWA
ncbi:Aldo/keto reductase [Violaceomyces palustris]|uniref:Aldo/keto reductase n=1 Tax=Violaceomyces palustris TaxID=1673888 RepID=A0ACD0NYM2_9BASI|nr:Aldo/keto reductase [Violaceomyces palustris]